ncbi:MAG TPA: tetratricopeptide repeat protein [Usitatibacteraceae bacterium]|nr:tetratricopeptide repeat protein [Usitatibacteraceae bacterium]
MRPILIALGFLLGGCVSIGAPPISESSAARVQELAERGNAEAQYHLGMFFNNGMAGKEQDPRRAFAWFQRAAQGGDALGAYKVGCYYAAQFPGAVPFDEAKALEFKLVAAQAGYANAQQEVGAHYYRHGDFANAEHWWKLAGAQGETGALFALSSLYLRGDGGKADAKLAYAYYKLGDRRWRALMKRDTPRITQISLDYLAEGLSAEDRRSADAFAEQFPAAPTPLTLDARNSRRRIEALIAAAGDARR